MKINCKIRQTNMDDKEEAIRKEEFDVVSGLPVVGIDEISKPACPFVIKTEPNDDELISEGVDEISQTISKDFIKAESNDNELPEVSRQMISEQPDQIVIKAEHLNYELPAVCENVICQPTLPFFIKTEPKDEEQHIGLLENLEHRNNLHDETPDLQPQVVIETKPLDELYGHEFSAEQSCKVQSGECDVPTIPKRMKKSTVHKRSVESKGLSGQGIKPQNRTVITESQKEVLRAMYEAGMKSKGKDCEHQHQEASMKTGLDIQIVKDWVGNHHKKITGKSHSYKKAQYKRGMTAYNCFVQDNKDQVGSMSEWSQKWKDLPSEEKEAYQMKAAQSKGQINDPKRAKKALLKEMYRLTTDLSALGMDIACVGLDDNDKIILIGDGNVGKHFRNQPMLLNDLLGLDKCGGSASDSSISLKSDSSISLKSDSSISLKSDSSISLKELRKEAQVHMNKLYEAASGKKVPFPYKSIQDGRVTVTGLPDTILPIRPVSCYGEKKLRCLLEVKEIKVSHTLSHTVSSTSTSSDLIFTTTVTLPTFTAAPFTMTQTLSTITTTHYDI